MRVSNRILSTIYRVLVPVSLVLVLMAIPSVVLAAAPCNQSNTVGGGALGVSPGPVGPPNSLGWDVGNGQCNGSFTVANDAGFTGGAIQIGLRGEERTAGPIARTNGNQYLVQLGSDTNQPNVNRAWWNFQASIAYGGDIDNLDSLTLTIQTLSGPNVPAGTGVHDLLVLRTIPDIDDRNNQPNATTTYADLYQISQNPVFGWFANPSDNDGSGTTPPDGFDYDEEGAWLFTITATEGTSTASTTMCIHTPGASCPPAQVPASSPWSTALLGLLLVGTVGFLAARPWRRTA